MIVQQHLTLPRYRLMLLPVSLETRTLHPIRMVLHRKNRTTTMRREIPTAHRLISRTVTTQVSPAADLAVQAK
jgi:hypothetical protein